MKTDKTTVFNDLRAVGLSGHPLATLPASPMKKRCCGSGTLKTGKSVKVMRFRSSEKPSRALSEGPFFAEIGSAGTTRTSTVMS